MNGEAVKKVEARTLHGAHFRYFDFILVAFVVGLLLSNVIGAEKRSFINLPGIGAWPFGAGVLFFPPCAAALALLSSSSLLGTMSFRPMSPVMPAPAVRSGPASLRSPSWR